MLKYTALSAMALLATVAISAVPASAREIRKNYYNVSPAMMHAIDVIVAEKMKMSRHR